MKDTTTAEQRAYWHTLNYLIAEAQRPRDAAAMRVALKERYALARRAAKLRFMPWDEWQAVQEAHLLTLIEEQCLPVRSVVIEDLHMAVDSLEG